MQAYSRQLLQHKALRAERKRKCLVLTIFDGDGNRQLCKKDNIWRELKVERFCRYRVTRN